jgi:hemolysin III
MTTGLIAGPRPLLRGRLHQVAFFASIPAGIIIILSAHPAVARVGASIYAASATGLYAASSTYHRFAHSVRARLIWRRLDHSMIYVLIAGTATPIFLLALHGPWRIIALATVWTGATTGIAIKMTSGGFQNRLGTPLYLMLGWVGILALPQLIRALHTPGMILLASGGVLYTVGAIILARRRPDPIPHVFGYHEVWHTLVVCGGVLHYVMILLVLRAAA